MKYTVELTMTVKFDVEGDDVAEAFDTAKNTPIYPDMMRLKPAATKMKDSFGNNIDIRNLM